MSNELCNEGCSSSDCMNFWKVSEFCLKAVFSNRQHDPTVIYKVEDSEPEPFEPKQCLQENNCRFPSGTIVAENLSKKTSFVYQVEKADGTVESLLVPPGCVVALYVTSIIKVSAYSLKGLLSGGRFYFDLIQSIE